MLLERDRELGLMADLLADVGAAGGKVVLLRGEAGIGKSSLVNEFIELHADEAHVSVGVCDDLLTPQPLGPFWDIARDEPSIEAALSDGDRRAVLGATMDLLSRSLRPNIVVVEDTQWADEATLDAIKYMGRRIASTNGLLLLTYRDGEVDYDHPLRGVIGELPQKSLVRIHLDGLSSQAVASMIDAVELEADDILALTGGNPLFVTEVLTSGVDGVPLSVQDSVLARAAKLSSAARLLLDLVSVIPGEAERSLIESIIDETDARLVECERQDLLRSGGNSLSFHHELTRRSVEAALSPADRRRLNQRVLDELFEMADPSRVVHHAREADNVAVIIQFAPQAARAAMAIESNREALAHFRTLEPHLEQIPARERAAIVDDWARTEFYLDNDGALDILIRAIDLHRSVDDAMALARALTFAVRVNEVNGRPAAAEACSAEAIEILRSYPVSADLAFAVSLSAWLRMMRGDGAMAIDLADQAMAIAEETGADLAMIHALNTKGTEAYMLGDTGGLRMLEEARSRAEQGGYAFEEIRALLNMTSAAAERRELELAEEFAQRSRDTAARYENRILEAYVEAQHAEILSWKGDWVAAEEIATEVLGSHPHVAALAGWVLGRLQARRGRPEAHGTLDRTWTFAEQTGEMQNLLPAAAALAEYSWLAGEGDPNQIARFRKLLESEITVAYAWPAGDLSLWLWKLGELSEIPEGIADPYRRVIEGDPRAAAEMWLTIGCPYERAVALTHGDAAAQLEALDILDTLGATAVSTGLRKTLRDQGVSVPRGKGRTTKAHAAGLTERQAEVLQLLGEGLSNTQIADRLFVSPRTVEHHVSAVLAKLDSSTRDEAVSRARSEGLLQPSGTVEVS